MSWKHQEDILLFLVLVGLKLKGVNVPKHSERDGKFKSSDISVEIFSVSRLVFVVSGLLLQGNNWLNWYNNVRSLI